MGHRKNGTFPGCIFVRNNKVYMKIGNQQRATGYNNTREGRKFALELKDQWYRDEFLNIQLEKTEPTTVYEAFILFLNELKRKERTNNTIRGYKLATKTFFPENAILNKSNVMNAVKNYLDQTISDNCISVNTITKNTYINKFQVFLNFCFENELIDKKLNLKSYKRKVTVKPKTPYTKEEFELLINTIKEADKEFALLLRFMSLTGSRITEALRLTWDDIDIAKKIIRMRNKRENKEFDVFPITDDIQIILNDLGEISKQRTNKSKKNKLFFWEPSSTSRLSRRLTAVEKKLGMKITGQSFHRIRNYFSNMILSWDISIFAAKDLMRHRDIRTTINHYKQNNPENLRSILESHQKDFNSFSTH